MDRFIDADGQEKTVSPEFPLPTISGDATLGITGYTKVGGSMEYDWNVDGTLHTITYKDGTDVLGVITFAWNVDGTLASKTRTS